MIFLPPKEAYFYMMTHNTDSFTRSLIEKLHRNAKKFEFTKVPIWIILE